MHSLADLTRGRSVWSGFTLGVSCWMELESSIRTSFLLLGSNLTGMLGVFVVSPNSTMTFGLYFCDPRRIGVGRCMIWSGSFLWWMMGWWLSPLKWFSFDQEVRGIFITVQISLELGVGGWAGIAFEGRVGSLLKVGKKNQVFLKEKSH